MKLEKMTIEKGKGSEIKIFQKHESYSPLDTTYTIKINQEKFKISTSQSQYPGGQFNKKTKETTWYLDHNCGAQGYSGMHGDNCNACDNQMTIEGIIYSGATTDEQIGKLSGNRNLSKIISYSLKIEDEINNLFSTKNIFE